MCLRGRSAVLLLCVVVAILVTTRPLSAQTHVAQRDLLGQAEEITLRYVRLRDFDGYVYFVPNGEIKVVVNRTRGFAQAVIDVVIKSSQKIDEAFAAMKEVGEQLRRDPKRSEERRVGKECRSRWSAEH